ncbi:unnamed protein product [Dracunculus medinensis]|uniref:Origin recognition complex subunit 5 n=1 Tax=Dracunculus medinensis TaxID=318479 RepID=A0A158Q419_DRAME|nr:unnamed protein product [Dracunculus medinensis]
MLLNCTLLDGSQRFFCREVQSNLPFKSGAYRNNCDTLERLCEFIENTIQVHEHKRFIIIVMQNAEALCKFPTHKGSLKFITVSTLPWHKFETCEHTSSPAQFAFPGFSKDDILNILCQKLPHNRLYLKLLLDTVYITCRDPDRLVHLIGKKWNSKSFNKLIDSDNSKYTTLLPELKRFSNYLFYGIDESLKVNEVEFIDVPYSTKFVLLASYCASYNPSSSDCQFFTKNHRKQRRKAFQRIKKDAAHESGPKSFELQRLIFIYLALIDLYGDKSRANGDVRLAVNISILTFVCDLIAMGCLGRISADGNIDIPKFKCLASFETVNHLSNSLGIVLRDHLYDFAIG